MKNDVFLQICSFKAIHWSPVFRYPHWGYPRIKPCSQTPQALSAAATLQTPCQAALIAAYVHHSHWADAKWLPCHESPCRMPFQDIPHVEWQRVFKRFQMCLLWSRSVDPPKGFPLPGHRRCWRPGELATSNCRPMLLRLKQEMQKLLQAEKAAVAGWRIREKQQLRCLRG